MLLAYHLFFHAPVHLGLESIGQERIEMTARSDTLWGAIIQKWLLLFDDEPDELCRKPCFDVTSCFPLVNGRRFYPLPAGSIDALMNEAAHDEQGNAPDVKALKKIRYISEPLLEKVMNGERLELEEISEASVYPFLTDNPGEYKISFAKQEQRPRIRTDQMNQGAGDEAFFYCTDQFFSKDSGMFFLADFEDASVESRFDASLRLLGDSGIGADRSVGKGIFSFVKKQVDLKACCKDACKYLLLSLLRPSRKDVEKGLLSKGRYSLVRRFGRAASNATGRFRRADAWMIEEGSILPFRPEGSVPVVLERNDDDLIPHNVYRYARGFCLPLA